MDGLGYLLAALVDSPTDILASLKIGLARVLRWLGASRSILVGEPSSRYHRFKFDEERIVLVFRHT